MITAVFRPRWGALRSNTPFKVAIDMPGAAFDVETELAILMEAERLIRSNGVPRHSWHTWDSWAGRQIYNEETTENWMRRILRQAMSTVLQNAQHEPPEVAAGDSGTHADRKGCLRLAQRCWAYLSNGCCLLGYCRHGRSPVVNVPDRQKLRGQAGRGKTPLAGAALLAPGSVGLM